MIKYISCLVRSKKELNRFIIAKYCVPLFDNLKSLSDLKKGDLNGSFETLLTLAGIIMFRGKLTEKKKLSQNPLEAPP